MTEKKHALTFGAAQEQNAPAMAASRRRAGIEKAQARREPKPAWLFTEAEDFIRGLDEGLYAEAVPERKGIVWNAICQSLRDKNMTQIELAEKMGMNADHLRRVIGGRRSLTANIAVRLSEVLGIETCEWMEWAEQDALDKVYAHS